MANQEYAEKEINLREYFNVLVKRKKTILAVFFIAVVASVIISLIIPRVYKATALIMIIPSKMQTVLSPSLISLNTEEKKPTNEYSSHEPTLSFATHKTLLKSSVVLEKLISTLRLKDKTNLPLNPEVLAKSLDIRESKADPETNILELQAEDGNPELAKEIANTWAQQYISYNQEFISGEVSGTGDFITEQFKISKQNLMNAEQRIKDFKNNYKMELMRSELEIKTNKINQNKKELLDLETALQTKRDALAELKKEIAKQDKFIILSKGMSDDAIWLGSGKKKQGQDVDQRTLKSQELNPIYQDLETRIVNTEIELNTISPKIDYLTKTQEQTKKEIYQLDETLNQKELEFNQLNRQLEIYKKTYENLANRIEEARIAKAAQLGEVKLISPALEPRYPIKPNRRLIVFSVSMASLLFGIFLAFFLEYWDSPQKEVKV